MPTSQWDTIWSVFHQALERPDDRRDAFVAAECEGDSEVVEEVRSLLAAHTSENLIDRLASSMDKLRFSVPERIGPYRIDAEIGRGGMGEVFLGRRESDDFDQTVAIKFATLARYSPDHLQRFSTERRLLSGLSHPGIAQLYDGGITDDGVPYFVMEYIDGEPVDEWCENLGLRDTLELFEKVCRAVHFAHTQLVVHRDLKPGNILVDSEGRPKLLDFGLARLLDVDDQTGQTTRAFATPEYASPEQLKGQSATVASDIYSLGVLLYRLLAGCTPYEISRDDMSGMVRTVCETVPPAPSKRVKDRRSRRLQGDLDQIVLTALRKDPERRYSSAAALGEDIRAFLDGRPVRAQPDTWRYRMAKFAGRHPLGVTAAAGTAVIVVGFAVAMWIQASALRQALDRAKQEQSRAIAVTEFLQDLFKASDPAQNSMPVSDVESLLDAGVERLGDELEAQPDIKASLLSSLGVVYNNRSRFGEAEALFRQALALQTRALGKVHPDTLATQAALGDIQIEKNQLDAAEATFNEILSYNPSIEQTASVMESLALLFEHRSDFETAEKNARLAVELYRSSAETSPEKLSGAYSRLSSILTRKGDYTAAYAETTLAQELIAGQFGPDHPRALTADIHAGQLALYAGKYVDSERLFRHAVEGRLARFGEEHLRTADAMNRLGAVLFYRKQLDEAASWMERALAVQKRLSPDTRGLSSIYNNLSAIRYEQGRLEEAREMMSEALAFNRRIQGEQSEGVATNLYNLAEFAYDAGDFADAARRLEQALAILTAIHDPGHPAIGSRRGALGQAYLRLGLTEDAEREIESGLAILVAAVGADHPDFANALVYRGELQIAQARYAEAAQSLQRALAGSDESSNDWHQAYLRSRLGEAMLRDGKPGEEHLAAGYNGLKTRWGDMHWYTLEAQERLGAAQRN